MQWFASNINSIFVLNKSSKAFFFSYFDFDASYAYQELGRGHVFHCVASSLLLATVIILELRRPITAVLEADVFHIDVCNGILAA